MGEQKLGALRVPAAYGGPEMTEADFRRFLTAVGHEPLVVDFEQLALA